jgi:hypothetical protein
MQRNHLSIQDHLCRCLLRVGWYVLPGLAAATKPDSAKIEQFTGVKSALNDAEGVFKVSVPCTDLSVRAAGVKLTPPMSLTAWAAFKRVGGHSLVMGDMVVLEDQVNPVMSVALTNSLEVTALHNHFFWDSPKVMFMHIGGMGNEAPLATAVWPLCRSCCKGWCTTSAG